MIPREFRPCPHRRPRRDTITTRTAPRWAWDIIDQTLELDQESAACTPDLRADIGRAYAAMRAAPRAAQGKR